jgi:hypothetical protein
MNPGHPTLSATQSLATLLEHSSGTLAEAFGGIQAAELRASELTVLIRRCENRLATATASLEPNGAIRSLLERERRRLVKERERLAGVLERMTERVTATCSTARQSAEAAQGLRTSVAPLQTRATATSGDSSNLSAAILRLEVNLQQAVERIEGIEDAMRAIVRRSSETGI